MSNQISQSPLSPAPILTPNASGKARSADEQASSERAPLEPAFRVSLSPAAQRLAKSSEANPAASANKPDAELTPDEEKEVAQLKKRDREVRAHEAAHKAAAGSLSSGSASFGFTTGPDGQRYATSGEVSIDTSSVSGDPDATIRKMQQVRAAALAPASPSSQDRKVAAQATAAAQAARSEAASEVETDAEVAPQTLTQLGPSQESQGTLENATQTTTPCSECGAEDHGPELHKKKNAIPVDLLA